MTVDYDLTELGSHLWRTYEDHRKGIVDSAVAWASERYYPATVRICLDDGEHVGTFKTKKVHP